MSNDEAATTNGAIENSESNRIDMNFIDLATRTSHTIPSAQPGKTVIAPSNALSSPNKSSEDPTVSKTISCSNCVTSGATTSASANPTIPDPQGTGIVAASDSSSSSTSGTNGTAMLGGFGNIGGEYVAL